MRVPTEFTCLACNEGKTKFKSPEHEKNYYRKMLELKILKEENPVLYAYTVKEAGLLRAFRKRAAAGNFKFYKWIQKVNYYGWHCVYCGKQLDMKTLTCDHVKPLCRGGTNFIANLVPACRSCNARKWADKRWKIKHRVGTHPL